MILGIHLTLLVGPTVAVPAPPPLTEALVGVEVTHTDQGKSGFQLTFQVGRSGPLDLLDYGLLMNPLLRPFNRVILTVLFNATPRVLMDGFITQQQLSPGSEPGAATLTVTGEDVSVMMDLDQKTADHVGQPESVIAFMILTQYMQYLLMPPMIIPPTSLDFPLPTDRIPVQRDTDLNYLNTLAQRFGHVFYVTPGPAPFQNTAYWGPPVRLGIPQPALSVNMGPQTNVESISFQYNALAPTMVLDVLQDSTLNQSLPVITFASTRIPPLALMPALPFNLPNVRKSLLDDQGGLTIAQAYARAQAKTDASTDNVVTATGSLNALQYGDLLTPRGIVGLRGAGFSYDGLYYVKNVTHSIKKGEYKQNFTLTREGTGSLVPFVRP
jgi:hypothetical protein